MPRGVLDSIYSRAPAFFILSYCAYHVSVKVEANHNPTSEMVLGPSGILHFYMMITSSVHLMHIQSKFIGVLRDDK